MNPKPVEARLKERRRGWFHDTDPGFHDFKAKMEEAQARNGDVKVAPEPTPKAASLARTPDEVARNALIYVLSKYALLDESGDPIVDLTRLIKDDDFGYTDRKPKTQQHARDEKALWGPKAGLGAGSVADRLGATANESYGGV